MNKGVATLYVIYFFSKEVGTPDGGCFYIEGVEDVVGNFSVITKCCTNGLKRGTRIRAK